MENVDVERGIVDETVESLFKCVGRKQNVTHKFSPSINMAPSTLRNLSPNSFKPRVVSIGPLHHKDENLQRFEVRKAAFVHDLLFRSGTCLLQLTLTECVEKVASMIENIRSCYADLKDYDDIELAKMMVMDACSILEFIKEISPGSIIRLQDQVIIYDLVLLENQIPFFVLKSIYECTIYKFEEEPLPITEFLLPLVKQFMLFEGRIKVGYGRHSKYTSYDHILGYVHHYYQPRHYIPSDFPSSTIHSAVELDSAGVNFKPNYINPNWAMAMEVKWRRSKIFWYLFMPTLTMPKLRIDGFTESVFRNLIAYEQLHVADPYVTSYLRAMNMLIDTHEDIAKLVRSEVIVNHIGTNEEAANMINRMCKEVGQEHFYYTQQFQQLDEHFNNYWSRKTSKLKRAFTRLKLTYFNSPWSIIALFAGINLFVLTWVQTIYTVKSSFTQKE